MDEQADPTLFGNDLQNSDSVSALKREQEDRPLSSETISISGSKESATTKNERPRIGDSISKVVQSGHGRRLEIRVVDETALIGSVASFPRAKNADDDEKTKTKTKTATITKTKLVYSRETLESVRFSNVKKQREIWRDVHVGLGPTVRKEYDFLLTCTASPNHHRHQPRNNFLLSNTPSASLSFSLPHSGSLRGGLNQVNVSAN